MLHINKLIIESFTNELSRMYHLTYGLNEPHYANIIEWSGCLALENIANCDALYHNVEHTVMVTLAGQEILRGKHLIEGGMTPSDWLHCILALLFHDIGYVKGICRADRKGVYATGIEGNTIEIGDDGSCASLMPYHIDRGKLFVSERFGGNQLMEFVDIELLKSYIEVTRFSPDDGGRISISTDAYPGLVKAADFIGQLGDPNYLRKIPALFYEFEEMGIHLAGYKNAGDMRRGYARFYWNVVSPYIQDALRYLQVTQEGKQWIANLYAHILTVEVMTREE
jgi:hypothetical protein